MTKIFNRHEQKEKRQVLRRNCTKAEKMLWQRIRAQQIGGWKFRQQYSVGSYILDFYCPQLKLAVEIDGPTHEGPDAEAYDAQRQAFVENLGIQFLRFSNEQIYQSLDATVESIAAKTETLAQTSACSQRTSRDKIRA